MQRFKNILAHVNLSSSEHPALSRGARLARQNDAKLTAMAVSEENYSQARAVLRSLHLEGQLELVEQQYRDDLERVVQPVRNEGRIEVETLVATGSIFLELIRAALKRGHDLILKTVSSEGIFHRTFFGSTDMQLLRQCPAPVWLIKAGEPATFRRILVPLEANIEDGLKSDLGMNLLKLATSLAERDGAELLIVHAWRPYAEDKLRRSMPRDKFQEYVRACSQESLNRTFRFIAPFQQKIRPNCIHVVQGEPGFVIPKFAKDHDVDLIVMGTLSRLGRHGVFIGGTAERILNRLECSVLAIKPAGFVSPVR